MKKCHFIVLSLFLLIIIGCDSKSQRFIFDEETHILRKIITYHSKDTTVSENCYYYDNGQKEAQGFYNKDKKEGKWTFWFKDGVEKYTANYENGITNLDHRYREIPQILLDEPLEVGKTTYFKVLNLYGWDALWVSDNAELDFSDDENYTYKITLLSEGPIYFYYDLLELVSINEEKYGEYSQMLGLSMEDIVNTRFYAFETIILNPLEKTLPETFRTSSLQELSVMEEYKAFTYYPNGDFKARGYISKLKWEGYRAEYYSDGDIRREIIYEDGKISFTRFEDRPRLEIFDSLRLFVPQKIRIVDVLPRDEISFTDNIIFTKLENDPLYDYEITYTGGDTASLFYTRKYVVHNPETFPLLEEHPYVTYIIEDTIITETIRTANLPIYKTDE